MRMMHHNPEMRPSYTEIIRQLSATLHNTDTSSFIIPKDMPLPKGPDGQRSPNSTSSLRVKAPSVMLKRRRSSISRIPPESAESFSPMELKKQSVSTFKAPPQRKSKKTLLLFLIILAALMAGFLVFSVVQLILAGEFSTKTVFPADSAK